MNKKRIALLITVCLFLLCGCGKDADVTSLAVVALCTFANDPAITF